MKILIIEDNTELANNINDYLNAQHYICEIASTYSEALEKIQLYEYDCILLDITLPDNSGLKLLEETPNLSNHSGIIIISAKDSLEDKINGIKLGADDYLTKPFALPELAVRVFSVIRRKEFGGNNTISYESIKVDLVSKSVFYANKKVPQLSNKEYQLFLFLLTSPDRVLTKETIAEHLFGEDADYFDNFNCVYAHVKNLKSKLKAVGCTEFIHSIYGMGYKLVK